MTRCTLLLLAIPLLAQDDDDALVYDFGEESFGKIVIRQNPQAKSGLDLFKAQAKEVDSQAGKIAIKIYTTGIPPFEKEDLGARFQKYANVAGLAVAALLDGATADFRTTLVVEEANLTLLTTGGKIMAEWRTAGPMLTGTDMKKLRHDKNRKRGSYFTLQCIPAVGEDMVVTAKPSFVPHDGQTLIDERTSALYIFDSDNKDAPVAVIRWTYEARYRVAKKHVNTRAVVSQKSCEILVADLDKAKDVLKEARKRGPLDPSKHLVKQED